MKRFFIAIAASVLLMFSCTGNRTGQGGEMPEDSVADSTDTVEIDTMELSITQTPMPRAADAMFDDFLFNFLANKRLQKERIVFPLRIFEGNKVEQMEERQWQMEHLFMRQGFVEKILLAKNQVKDYMFRRIRGAWMLCEVRVNEVDQNVNASFLKFYQKFASDSAFQVKSLNETVQFVGPDPDDDFNMMEGVITADTWEAFAPTLPAKSIYNVIYGKPQEEGNNKIFLLRGVANGLELELRFKRAGDKWLLMKMTT